MLGLDCQIQASTAGFDNPAGAIEGKYLDALLIPFNGTSAYVAKLPINLREGLSQKCMVASSVLSIISSRFGIPFGILLSGILELINRT